MNKSVDDVVTEATFVMFSYIFIISKMIEDTTGIDKQHSIVVANVMLDKKTKELSSNMDATCEELHHYIEACKRQLFGEENENE